MELILDEHKEYTIKLKGVHLLSVLRGLDALPHREARGPIDLIAEQVKKPKTKTNTTAMTLKIVNSENTIVYDPSSCDDAFDYMINAGEAAGYAIAATEDNVNWFSFIGPHPIEPPKR